MMDRYLTMSLVDKWYFPVWNPTVWPKVLLMVKKKSKKYHIGRSRNRKEVQNTLQRIFSIDVTIFLVQKERNSIRVQAVFRCTYGHFVNMRQRYIVKCSPASAHTHLLYWYVVKFAYLLSSKIISNDLYLDYYILLCSNSLSFEGHHEAEVYCQ